MNGILTGSNEYISNAIFKWRDFTRQTVIKLDADDSTKGGGNRGSIYIFHYQSANTVFAEFRVRISGGQWSSARMASAMDNNGIS